MLLWGKQKTGSLEDAVTKRTKGTMTRFSLNCIPAYHLHRKTKKRNPQSEHLISVFDHPRRHQQDDYLFGVRTKNTNLTLDAAYVHRRQIYTADKLSAKQILRRIQCSDLRGGLFDTKLLPKINRHYIGEVPPVK